MPITRPLDRTATGQADDVFYCRHPEMAPNGKRVPLHATSSEHAAMRSEWVQLYEDILAHNRDGSRPFPTCPDDDHDHHDPACPHCEEPAVDPVTPDDPEEPPAPDDPDPVEPCEECEQANLVVMVKDSDGNPVAGVDISVPGIGNMQTDENGVADYGVVNAGTYDVSAFKAGHGPKRNDPEGPDTETAVSVPTATTTVVELEQHPICANVAFFEGSTTRANYFGFDHKTNIVAAANGEYWKPVPDRGTLTLPGSKTTRDGGRWVSVAVGKETEVEINFDFKTTECIPCIANSTFTVIPASVADVVTTSVSSKKANFKIKGKAAGEASLKVVCDGMDIGWFHIWCKPEATIKVDVVCVVTNRAPAFTYSVAALSTVFNDIYKQACIKVNMFDLGQVDLTGNAAFAAQESQGYPAAAGGKFLDKGGTAPNRAYDKKATVLTAIDTFASAIISARTAAPLPRTNAYRIYWYVPTNGCSIGGTVANIGSSPGYAFMAESAASRNSMAHEFGHCLNLRHPSDGASSSQFATHNRATENAATPAYAATNTEPATTAKAAKGNVMGNDPTNLMGYWSDKPNRKRLRYHQWKAASRS